MDIEEQKQPAAADMAPGQRDGFEFTSLGGCTEQNFAKTKSEAMTQRFFRW